MKVICPYILNTLEDFFHLLVTSLTPQRKYHNTGIH